MSEQVIVQKALPIRLSEGLTGPMFNHILGCLEEAVLPHVMGHDGLLEFRLQVVTNPQWALDLEAKLKETTR